MKRLRDGVKLEEENHEKHKEKLALKHTWAELEEDLMENVVEPIKKWTGLMNNILANPRLSSTRDALCFRNCSTSRVFKAEEPY